MNNQRVDILIAQLHDHTSDKPDDQFRAAIELGKISEVNLISRITDELIKALSPEHQALTRAHAAEALGKLGNPKAIPQLIKALKDNYQLVRSYAARALGKMSDITAIEAINELIPILGKDEFFGARAEAAEALGKLCTLCDEDDYDAKTAKESAEVALKNYQEKETKRLNRGEEEGRSERVLAEMERSLEKLNIKIDEAVNEIRRLQSKLSKTKRNTCEQDLKKTQHDLKNMEQKLNSMKKDLKPLI